jgi:phosphoenolpyruvate synthase/pyruvate phosphate dikinase
MAHVVWLEDCAIAGREVVGGKAVGLGSLFGLGLQVPRGFVVTSDAYRSFVLKGGVGARIERALKNTDSVKRELSASHRIRALFERSELTRDIASEIATAYELLGHGDSVPVAVRSSATAEDSAEASFAGQQETYLWVKGAEAVARHVVRCWSSLFTPQAMSYRSELGLETHTLGMGVVVQRMVAAESAGVMMTIDPVTGDPSQIVIESSYGLGLAVVGGEVTPDRFCVDKVTLAVRSRSIAEKQIAYRFDTRSGQVRQTPVKVGHRDRPSLFDEEVVEIARLGKTVERALGWGQDIEWAIGEGPDNRRQIYFLQARPETVWRKKQRASLAPPGTTMLDRIVNSLMTPVPLHSSGV